MSSSQELTQALGGDCNLFVVGDIAQPWWYKALTLPDIQIWCAFPPCQPFSTASRGPGLMVQEWQAVLHLTSLLEVIRPPVLCLEQVRGFALHPHFGFLRELWNFLGFRLTRSDVIDLHDFWHQLRGLATWPNSCVRMLFPLPPFPPWVKGPTLGSFKRILHLPEFLLKDCILDPALRAIYMDPKYVPRSAHTRRQRSPSAFRLRGPKDQAGCIMACYHYQHELPPDCLARNGILATLYDGDCEPRFFSGAEVALMHVAVRPVYLPAEDRVQMRGLGNSLAVPQALICLARAVSLLVQPSSA